MIKLNTQLKAVKSKEDTRVIDLLEKIVGIQETLSRAISPPLPEPQIVEAPVKPSSFTLKVKRKEDGAIDTVRALDAATGRLFYSFSVNRDREGSLTSISAQGGM